MYEFDPRWPDDPRDDEHNRDLSRGSRGSSDDRDSGRDLDPRDVFMSQVDLPRGLEREHVFEHDHIPSTCVNAADRIDAGSPIAAKSRLFETE
jgi:hypothetical protein